MGRLTWLHVQATCISVFGYNSSLVFGYSLLCFKKVGGELNGAYDRSHLFGASYNSSRLGLGLDDKKNRQNFKNSTHGYKKPH